MGGRVGLFTLVMAAVSSTATAATDLPLSSMVSESAWQHSSPFKGESIAAIKEFLESTRITSLDVDQRGGPTIRARLKFDGLVNLSIETLDGFSLVLGPPGADGPGWLKVAVYPGSGDLIVDGEAVAEVLVPATLLHADGQPETPARVLITGQVFAKLDEGFMAGGAALPLAEVAGTGMRLYSDDVVVDLHSGLSPERKDKAWQGLYMNNAVLELPASLGGQTVHAHGLTVGPKGLHVDHICSCPGDFRLSSELREARRRINGDDVAVLADSDPCPVVESPDEPRTCRNQRREEYKPRGHPPGAIRDTYIRIRVAGCDLDKENVTTALQARVLAATPHALVGQRFDSPELSELFRRDGDWYTPTRDKVELSDKDAACVERLRALETRLRSRSGIDAVNEAAMTADRDVFFWLQDRGDLLADARRFGAWSSQGVSVWKTWGDSKTTRGIHPYVIECEAEPTDEVDTQRDHRFRTIQCRQYGPKHAIPAVAPKGPTGPLWAKYRIIRRAGCRPTKEQVATPLEARVLSNVPLAHDGYRLKAPELAAMFTREAVFYAPKNDHVTLAEKDAKCVRRIKALEKRLRRRSWINRKAEAVLNADRTYSVNPSKLDPGSSNFRQLGYCLSDFRRVHRICTADPHIFFTFQTLSAPLAHVNRWRTRREDNALLVIADKPMPRSKKPANRHKRRQTVLRICCEGAFGNGHPRNDSWAKSVECGVFYSGPRTARGTLSTHRWGPVPLGTDGVRSWAGVFGTQWVRLPGGSIRPPMEPGQDEDKTERVIDTQPFAIARNVADAAGFRGEGLTARSRREKAPCRV